MLCFYVLLCAFTMERDAVQQRCRSLHGADRPCCPHAQRPISFVRSRRLVPLSILYPVLREAYYGPTILAKWWTQGCSWGLALLYTFPYMVRWRRVRSSDLLARPGLLSFLNVIVISIKDRWEESLFLLSFFTTSQKVATTSSTSTSQRELFQTCR